MEYRLLASSRYKLEIRLVNDTEISVTHINDEDYICLTGMIKAKDGDFFITDWLRNRNTLEYIGIWEKVYNPDFNYGEFAIIKSQSGLNSFKISVKEFVAKTNAISIQAKAGNEGKESAEGKPKGGGEMPAFTAVLLFSPSLRLSLCRDL